MRFEVKDLNSLKKAVEQIDEDDRLSLNISVNRQFPQLTSMRFAVRITKKGIFVHEMKGFKNE